MYWLTQYVASNPPLLTGPLSLVMQNWTFDEIWARFVPFCIPDYLRVNLPLAPHYVVLVNLPKMRCSGCMVISRTARTMCDLIDGDNVSAPRSSWRYVYDVSNSRILINLKFVTGLWYSFIEIRFSHRLRISSR